MGPVCRPVPSILQFKDTVRIVLKCASSARWHVLNSPSVLGYFTPLRQPQSPFRLVKPDVCPLSIRRPIFSSAVWSVVRLFLFHRRRVSPSLFPASENAHGQCVSCRISRKKGGAQRQTVRREKSDRGNREERKMARE